MRRLFHVHFVFWRTEIIIVRRAFRATLRIHSKFPCPVVTRIKLVTGCYVVSASQGHHGHQTQTMPVMTRVDRLSGSEAGFPPIIIVLLCEEKKSSATLTVNWKVVRRFAGL